MTRRPDPYAVSELDWAQPESLVRFAVMARIDGLCDALGWTRSKVAERLQLTSAGLHEKLTTTGLLRASAPDFVRDLQRLAQVVEAQLPRSGGELFSFYEAVMNRWTGTETLRVPSTFFEPLLATGDSSNVEEVLARAAALVGIRRQAFNLEEAARLRLAYSGRDVRDLVADTMQELLTVVGLPHPQHMLAVGLAAELEDWVLPVVEQHLRESPVGWRSPQILTRMLSLYDDRTEIDRGQYLFLQIGKLLEDVTASPPHCPDPGRVFIEEALSRTPGRRATTGDRPLETWNWPWARDYLRAIALDPDKPLRQRAHAAISLASRNETAGDVTTIVSAFRSEAAADTTEGLSYAVDVLEEILHRRQGRSSTSRARAATPDRGVMACPNADAYRRVGRYFDLELADPNQLPGPLELLHSMPQSVRIAAQALILEAALSVDATRRRTACDTLIAAGAARETTSILTELLHNSETPIFVQEQITVVLGYLGDPSAIPAVVSLTHDLHPSELQLPAAIALGEMHSADQHPDLAELRIQALGDTASRGKTSDLRHAAVLSLATLSEVSSEKQRVALFSRIASSRAPAATRRLAEWGHQRLTSTTVLKAIGDDC